MRTALAALWLVIEAAASSPVVIAENLRIPWEVVFLPDGRILVTERPGYLALLKDGGLQARIRVPYVLPYGEGGLLGAALHPRFAGNRWLYLYYTTRPNGGIVNRVVRYRLAGDRLENQQVILDHIPAGRIHDGGRIAFGPDGRLYIGAGDAGNQSLAQDTRSLAGKILRINDDGSVPPDNPFGNPVWSYGHRNPEGLAWDSQGQLWATEHGLVHLDEVNRIERGANYGWPAIMGDQQRSGMRQPELHSGRTTWAPSGAAVVGGKLYFAGLLGSALYEADISGDRLENLKEQLKHRYGRLRAVVRGPDGALYVTTSNRDGRGKLRQGDDKLIRLAPTPVE
jgi:glucose/arabinose dehydrogenase